MTPLPATTCPLCGGPNHCLPAASGSFDGECWCQSATISPAALARVPAELVDKACLCPRCAAAVDGPRATASPS